VWGRGGRLYYIKALLIINNQRIIILIYKPTAVCDTWYWRIMMGIL